MELCPKEKERWQLAIFQSFLELGELESDEDGETGDCCRIDKEGEETTSGREPFFHIAIDKFLNEGVPGECRDESEPAGCKG